MPLESKLEEFDLQNVIPDVEEGKEQEDFIIYPIPFTKRGHQLSVDVQEEEYQAIDNPPSQE
ncbi:hypothetical protein KI387_030086, partial [Taxus chinensis]